MLLIRDLMMMMMNLKYETYENCCYLVAILSSPYWQLVVARLSGKKETSYKKYKFITTLFM